MIGLKKKKVPEKVTTVESLEEPVSTDQSETESQPVQHLVRKRVSALNKEESKPLMQNFKATLEEEKGLEEEEFKPNRLSFSKLANRSAEVDEDEEEGEAQPEETKSNGAQLEPLQNEAAESKQTAESKPVIESKQAESVWDTPNVEDKESEEIFTEPEESSKGVISEGENEIYSILARLQNVVENYNKGDCNYESENISIRYAAGVREIKVEDGWMYFPIRRVYVNGSAVKFDTVDEVRLKSGDKIELDLGVSIVIPKGYILEFKNVENAKTKFGIEIPEGTVVRAPDAIFNIVVPVIPIDDLAYVCKNRSIVRATLKAI